MASDFELVLDRELASIAPLDNAWLEKARRRLAEQTRPPGSLGRLEEIAARLAAIRESLEPSCREKRLYIFASDHGVEAEGVSAYPREVTAAMVTNFLAGGATVNAFARALGVDVKIVDVGVDADLGEHPRLVSAKIRRGSANIRYGPAMTIEEAERAVGVGLACAREAHADGIDLLASGEMGIANTAVASAVAAALTGLAVKSVTGRGTGLSEEGLLRKIQVIEDALRVNQGTAGRPMETLARVGGFEIGALAGLCLGAARWRIPLVVDGWIATASAILAVRMQPAAAEYLFFGHRSSEAGHGEILRWFGFDPILDLGMRLGEGTGACLAMPILEAACAMLKEVATFEEARVPNRRLSS